MKKVLNIISIIICCMISCKEPSSVVQGDLGRSEWDGKFIYLQLLNDKEMQPEILDSAMISNGKFQFEQSATIPQTALLSVEKQNQEGCIAQFVLEQGQIKISMNERGNIQIAGTPNNDLLQKHFEIRNEPIAKMQQIYGEMDRLNKAGKLTGPVFDSLDRICNGYMREMRLLTLEFVKENINNPAGKSQLMEIMGLPDRLLADVIDNADSLAFEHPLVQKIEERGNTVKAVGIGKPFQNVMMVDMNNEQVHLSDYIKTGKYILIDFWASWCKPCCTAMAELKKLYDKYGDKGFEIIGISLDQDKTEWKNKVRELKMNWPQALDIKKEAVKKYVVGAIPHTVLIDPSGIIVAKDLSGKELEDKMAQCLK